MRRAVDDLDETIKIIRSTIFGLRTRDGDEAPRAAGPARCGWPARCGTGPGLHAQRPDGGPSSTPHVPPETADHVIAVLAESLTNIARHAHAGRADVVLETDGNEVRLTVTTTASASRPRAAAAACATWRNGRAASAATCLDRPARRGHPPDLARTPAVPGARGPLGPVVRIMPASRGVARASAALSSLADAPRRLPSPPCSCTHHAALGPAERQRARPADLIRTTGPHQALANHRGLSRSNPGPLRVGRARTRRPSGGGVRTRRLQAVAGPAASGPGSPRGDERRVR